MHLPRHLDRWLWPYLRRKRRRGRPAAFIISACDHFEPFHKTDQAGALKRVGEWANRYADSVAPFADSGGRSARHTFFYPIEQYDRQVLDGLSEICSKTGCEVEVHLHHDRDTEAGLERSLEEGKKLLRDHGLLGSDLKGNPVYGFIHGNWAIGNCAPGGTHCGVDRELEVLKRTGCYADFTMPSAPHPTQLGRINSVYYCDVGSRGRALCKGQPVSVSDDSDGSDDRRLLMVQGPLGLNWRRRKWGGLPRIENGDLTAANLPTLERFRLWEQLCPSVAGKEDWVFIKLHTHGALPKNSEMFLGSAMESFHRALADAFPDPDGDVRFYYASAREMANLIHAAESGCSGSPSEHLDYRYSPPPVSSGPANAL